MSKLPSEQKISETSANDTALPVKSSTDQEKLEVASNERLEKKSAIESLEFLEDEKKGDELELDHSHINFDGEHLSYLKEPKIKLSEDWMTIKAELNEIWEPLSLEEEKNSKFRVSNSELSV